MKVLILITLFYATNLWATIFYCEGKSANKMIRIEIDKADSNPRSEKIFLKVYNDKIKHSFNMGITNAYDGFAYRLINAAGLSLKWMHNFGQLKNARLTILKGFGTPHWATNSLIDLNVSCRDISSQTPLIMQ